MKDRCPTCGEPVETVTSEEGTSHYESVAAKRIEELEAALRNLLPWAPGYNAHQTTCPLHPRRIKMGNGALRCKCHIDAIRLARAALETAPSESEGKRS